VVRGRTCGLTGGQSGPASELYGRLAGAAADDPKKKPWGQREGIAMAGFAGFASQALFARHIARSKPRRGMAVFLDCGNTCKAPGPVFRPGVWAVQKEQRSELLFREAFHWGNRRYQVLPISGGGWAIQAVAITRSAIDVSRPNCRWPAAKKSAP